MTVPRTDEEWLELARAAGSLDDSRPHCASGGTAVAREALARVLSENFLLETMELALGPSRVSELARSMLSLLRPLCVVAPLTAKASDTTRTKDERLRALDVLQVIARPEAMTELYAIAKASEGDLHRKASWGLVEGMLGLDRPFSDEVLEDEIIAFLCSSSDPSVRDLAECLADESEPPRVDAEAIRRLLDQLCVNEGFCLPPSCVEFLVQRPPARVADFVDAVFLLEGLDPLAAEVTLYRSVYAEVAAMYDDARRQSTSDQV